MNLQKEIISKRNVIQKKVIRWAKKHLRKYPWREYRTPYRVLVAEILLRRTTATAVLQLYEKFIKLYPKTQNLAEANEAELRGLIERIGLHKRRSNMLIRMAKHIMREYGGRIPDSKEDLLKIPLVGPYAANAVLTLGYNIPSAMVDSNVERIIKRLFSEHLPPILSPSMIQQIADNLAPDFNNQEYNLSLIDLGALICRYDVPHCEKCPLSSECDTHSAMSRKKIV